MKTMHKFIIALMLPIFVFSMWDKYPVIPSTVNGFFDPWLGELLKWNLTLGFILIAGFFALLQTIAQKYLTDQKEMKKLREEQKILQEEMKKYREHPEKLMELQKKQFEFIPKTYDLTVNSLLYTSVPFVLLFRWFSGYLQPVWGGWWIFWYIVVIMIFSTQFRKLLDVA